MREEGDHLEVIANTLNDEGLIGKKGGRFQKMTISKILNNSIYNEYR
jgi:hypothetical protein